jgi:uncharacterized protein (DUF1501 family)
MINRRHFLERATLLAVGSLVPSACAVRRTDANASLENVLVLVELTGGNDGLNTVIPYADPLYAKLRPRLAIAREDVVQLNGELGLHPGLAPLMSAWSADELAIVCGLGYPDPDLSHFRSIDIWDTASDSRQLLADGWVARALPLRPERKGRAADAVVLGRPSVGPLMGTNVRVAVMDNAQNFANTASRVEAVPAVTDNAALAHVVRTQADLRGAGSAIQESLKRLRVPITTSFPKTGIGGQLSNAARLIASGTDMPVIKVSQGSYDTHTYERNTHDRLMSELGAALAAFRDAMKEMGHWDRVTVMTYSEFGRRAAENSAMGTDHGTAAPHFLMGSAVSGGLYGRQPSLADLDNGNLRHHVDFRSLYASVLRHWWNIAPTPVLGRNYPELKLFV